MKLVTGAAGPDGRFEVRVQHAQEVDLDQVRLCVTLGAVQEREQFTQRPSVGMLAEPLPALAGRSEVTIARSGLGLTLAEVLDLPYADAVWFRERIDDCLRQENR